MAVKKLSVSNPQRFDVGRANHHFPAGCENVEVEVSDYRAREVLSCAHLSVKDLGDLATEDLVKYAANPRAHANVPADDGARATADHYGVDLANVTPSREGGRVSRGDVVAHIAARDAAEEGSSDEAAEQASSESTEASESASEGSGEAKKPSSSKKG